MPIYEYRPVASQGCSHCRDGFEILQKLSDQILKKCPACGNPIQRIISAPNLARADHSLDKSNLEKHGFTQYTKAEKGVYEKTAGSGPEVLKDV